MSTLTYNGVTIGLTKTLGIAHEPVRADDETYLYTRVTIDVEGIVQGTPTTSQNAATNPPAVATTVGGVGGPPISDVMESIRQRLLMERQYLVYDAGDRPAEPMITAPALDGNGMPYPCDAANGPIPGPLTITRVDGIKAFHVRYRVACHLLECPGYSGDGPPALISNRFSQAHAIDGSTFLTTITTSGQAFFRTDVLEGAQQVADHFRDVLLPPVPLGFKRMGVTIVATPARNALTYQVVDAERTFDLGDTGPNGTNSNITDVKGNYMVGSTALAGGAVSLVTQHSVNVTVSGSKAASQWTLVKACFAYATAKLPISDPSRGFLTQIAINQSQTDRTASLQATMLLNQQAAGPIPGIDATALQQDGPFAPQGGLNPALPGRSGTAGTYQNEMLASAWKSACQVPKKPYEGAVASSAGLAAYSDGTGPIVTTSVTEDLPDLPRDYSFEQTRAAFTEYKIDIVLESSTGVMAAPIAGKAPAAGYSYSPGGAGSGSGSGASPEDDGPDQEFLTLARPSQRLVVEWSAERVGAPPIVPASKPVDPNRVLIDAGHVQLAEPNLLVDGTTRAYRASGRYIYGLKKCLKPTDAIPWPAPPWQVATYGDDVLTADFFQDNIIDGALTTSPGQLG